jgi:prepilin-type N-terminal cleavage/methylation domain-containing protein
MEDSTAMRNRRGFSLIELLVVIGIILVIAGIALPMLIRAYSYSAKSAAAFNLNTIAVGLEAYKQDMGDYPRTDYADTTSGERGARVLAWALLAPQAAAQDGADGLGFRVRAGMGKVCGPYLQLDRLKLSAQDNTAKITNKDGGPILYYPANPVKPNINAVASATNGGYCGPTPAAGSPGPLYNSSDNSTLMATNNLRGLLGDFSANGAIDSTYGTETAVGSLPFILIDAGADGGFGPSTALTTAASAATWTTNKNLIAGCDDITNFPR